MQVLFDKLIREKGAYLPHQLRVSFGTFADIDLQITFG
jgi:hypothetical protein